MDFSKLSVIFLSAVLVGCAGIPSTDDLTELDLQTEHRTSERLKDIPGWRHHVFPGKRASHYYVARNEGVQAIGVSADASVSMLKRDIRIEPRDLAIANFSWRVPALIRSADMAVKERDDSPVRVVLVFDGDRSKFSGKDAMLSELARALTGEELPYATLMYVWSNERQPETVIVNPRTSRIRKIVVESGPGNLNRWLIYRRDIRADFEAAFGEPPGALLTLALMTDTDNTRTKTQAWYGPVEFSNDPLTAWGRR